eukprot:TRINITY_DN15647_c0_g1_i1.p1 TRINITY_DN15647_c0_g1~~TRINITY_DN15647_c0_g1_i1.p1  ORF type:complete len:239 (-),score=30.00 TRINITY_DN15647_c0_g1_i1:192-908(-)
MVKKYGGATLLSECYGNSVATALTTIYSEISWNIWNFHSVPRMHWKDKRNQRKFFDALSDKLNITSFESWYNISARDISKAGGAGLLSEYGNSPFKAVVSVYSEYPFQLWKFTRVPRGSWETKSIMHDYIEYVGEKLGVIELDDWYRVSRSQLTEVGAVYFFEYHGGMFETLSKVYPSHTWDLSKLLLRQKKSMQWRVATILKQLLDDKCDVVEEYVHPYLKFPDTGRPLFLTSMFHI